MNLAELNSSLEQFILESEYSAYLLKNWIYRDQVSVLDFTYQYVKFAFDFEILPDSVIAIYLVDRNSCLNLFFNKAKLEKTLLKKVPLEMVFDYVIETLSSLFKIIDREFKYQVSVIIPTYNREKLILKCIDSLNTQTLSRQDFEVIFVDDNSSDSTVELIEANVDKDLNYQIVRRDVGSGNASAPRNDGFKVAKGRFIFYLDSDDYMVSDCLEKGLQLAIENSSDMVFFKIGTPSDNPRGIPKRVFKKGTVGLATVKKNNLMRANYVFKFFSRSVLLKNNILFDPAITVSEDRLYNIQYLSRVDRVSILADKDYIILVEHDGEHLHKTAKDLKGQLHLFCTGFHWIFTSDLSSKHCLELFNAWYIIVLQKLISVLKDNKITQKDKKEFFYHALIFVDNWKYKLSDEFFYNHLKKFVPYMNTKDFDGFCNLINTPNE